MIIEKQALTVLLNAFYELDERTITVEHPATEVGELITIELADPSASHVSVSKGTMSYDEQLDVIEREYGSRVKNELPNAAAYLKTFVASKLVDIRNRDEVDTFLKRYGYQDLQAGHPPRYAGIDTNLLPWRMHDVLEIDPELYSDSKGRAPVNGYTLPAGVGDELSISYRYDNDAMDVDRLVTDFGPECAAFAGQPNEANRETRLGLREYRRLREQRPHDIVSSDRGDEAIIEGCLEYYEDEPTGVILFSNDFGFVDAAREQKIPAVHVDFDIDVPQRLTGSWEQISTLLYMLAVTFGVVVLPKATIYGVWDSKQSHHWQQETLKIEARSNRLQTILERDKPIVDAYNL